MKRYVSLRKFSGCKVFVVDGTGRGKQLFYLFLQDSLGGEVCGGRFEADAELNDVEEFLCGGSVRDVPGENVRLQ